MKTSQKRATVYFHPRLHRALKIKAAETERSVSELVNEAVRQSLAEDSEDLAAFEEKAHETDVPIDEVLKNLKKHGQI